jgi:secreted trypsin-like serine protease
MQMRVHLRYCALSLFALSAIFIVAPIAARAFWVTEGKEVEQGSGLYKFQVALIYNRDHPNFHTPRGAEWRNFQCGGTLISIPSSEPPSQATQDHNPHTPVGHSGPPEAPSPTGLESDTEHPPGLPPAPEPSNQAPQPQGPGWVLTAAHCVVDPTSSHFMADENLQIYAGSYDFRNGQLVGSTFRNGQLVSSNHIYPHPLYDPSTGEYDVALIQLADPLVISTTKVTAVDPGQDDTLFKNQKANAVGWGTISDWNRVNLNFYDRPLSKRLQEVTLDLMQHDECNKQARTEDISAYLVNRFNRLPREHAERLALSISSDNAFGKDEKGKDKTSPIVTEHMICGVDNSKAKPGAVLKGTCFGDSGGPLLVAVGGDGKASDPGKVKSDSEFRQIGITSFGPPKTCGVGVSVFTNVANSEIHNWIKDTMSGASGQRARGLTTSAARPEALSPTSRTQEQDQERGD